MCNSQHKWRMRFACIIICVMLLTMSACGKNTNSANPVPVTESPIGAITVENITSTATPEPEMRAVLNGFPYAFAHAPKWDGTNVWVPGEEMLRLLEAEQIDGDGTWLSGNYSDNEGQYRNCYFSWNETSYASDTIENTWLEADTSPYSDAGILYLTETMLESIFGECMRYSTDENILTITIRDKQIAVLQQDNDASLSFLALKSAEELEDTRVNALVSFCIKTPAETWLSWADRLKKDGFTNVCFTTDAIDGPAVDLSYTAVEESIPDAYVDVFRYLDENGIKTKFYLSFWDMAYRLNGGALKNPIGKNLYEFWGTKIGEFLNNELAKHKNKVLINLASNEYFKAIKPNSIKGEIITPVFKEAKGNGYKVITVYSKTARGLMSRFIIQNRIENPEDIKAFDADGYLYNNDLSTEKEWVFVR